jgi:hypothetical protein
VTHKIWRNANANRKIEAEKRERGSKETKRIIKNF